MCVKSNYLSNICSKLPHTSDFDRHRPTYISCVTQVKFCGDKRNDEFSDFFPD